MATAQAVVQYTIQDADGNRKSLPVYQTYDDSTVTLSQLKTRASIIAGLLDAITDGQLVSYSLTLDLVLPTGIKTSPVTGSNVQESGLITYLTDAPIKRSYGQDIPAFFQTGFNQAQINLSDTDVLAWTAQMLATGAVTRMTNSDFLANLASVRTGKKTFRKQRRTT